MQRLTFITETISLFPESVSQLFQSAGIRNCSADLYFAPIDTKVLKFNLSNQSVTGTAHCSYFTIWLWDMNLVGSEAFSYL